VPGRLSVTDAMRCAIFVLACGCYAPAVPSGVPCSSEGRCPGDQRCVAGICGGAIPGGDGPLDDSSIEPDAAVGPDAPPITLWAVPMRVAALSTAGDDFGPSLFANGLRIYVASDVANGGSHRIYYASRASSTSAFSMLQVANELDVAGAEEYDAEVSMAGVELHFVSSANPRGIRQTSRASTTTPWTVPAMELGLTDREGPSLAVSDTRMVVSRHTTGGIEEYTRSTASSSWTLVRTHATLGGMVYPGISADGLEIYATTKNDDHLFRATRASIDDPFGTPARVLFGGGLDGGQIYDPELSSDGNTLYLAINTGAGYDIYVTTR